MYRALLIACSVILVVVLFCPIIAWSQTASIFTVIGTVEDANRAPAENGLAVIVRNATTDVTLYAVTGGITNAHLLPNEIIVGKGEFVAVFPPSRGNQAATLGDKIIIQVPDLYKGEEFSYTVAESNIVSGRMEVKIPYYHFTLSLVKDQNWISIPLAEATVEVEGEIVKTPEGNPVKIKKVSDLGIALGTTSWDLIITYDNEGNPQSYGRNDLLNNRIGIKSDIVIDGYTGLIVVMREPKTLKLTGKGWPEYEINLANEANLIGIPLKNDNIVRVSDLGELLGDCWNLIITYDSKEQKSQSYGRNDLLNNRIGIKSDIVINGGIGLLIVVTTNKTCTLSIKGNPWSN